MHNENTSKPNNSDIEALETEIREAVASGSHIQDTVHRLTLKAMDAQRIDLESIQRIITAVMQGAHDGATQQLQQATNQAHAAKSQVKLPPAEPEAYSWSPSKGQFVSR